MKKKFRRIRPIFDIEKWLWKPELCYIWPSIPNRTKYLEHFYGRFHRPLALFNPPLNSATLSCSSEVTLDSTYIYRLDGQVWIISFQIISVISIAFVVASTIGMTMNTISSIQHRNINNEPIDNPKLALIEAICISWFTIEYLLRLAGIYSEHHWPSPLYAHFRRLFVSFNIFHWDRMIADTRREMEITPRP